MNQGTEAAMQLLRQQDFSGAAALLAGECAANPADAETHQLYGAAASAAGLHNEAIHALSRAVELDPYSAAARYNLAVAYGKAGHAEYAVTTLQGALQLQPDYPRAAAKLQEFQSQMPPPAPVAEPAWMAAEAASGAPVAAPVDQAPSPVDSPFAAPAPAVMEAPVYQSPFAAPAPLAQTIAEPETPAYQSPFAAAAPLAEAAEAPVYQSPFAAPAPAGADPSAPVVPAYQSPFAAPAPLASEPSAPEESSYQSPFAAPTPLAAEPSVPEAPSYQSPFAVPAPLAAEPSAPEAPSYQSPFAAPEPTQAFASPFSTPATLAPEEDAPGGPPAHLGQHPFAAPEPTQAFASPFSAPAPLADPAPEQTRAFTPPFTVPPVDLSAPAAPEGAGSVHGAAPSEAVEPAHNPFAAPWEAPSTSVQQAPTPHNLAPSDPEAPAPFQAPDFGGTPAAHTEAGAPEPARSHDLSSGFEQEAPAFAVPDFHTAPSEQSHPFEPAPVDPGAHFLNEPQPLTAEPPSEPNFGLQFPFTPTAPVAGETEQPAHPPLEGPPLHNPFASPPAAPGSSHEENPFAPNRPAEPEKKEPERPFDSGAAGAALMQSAPSAPSTEKAAPTGQAFEPAFAASLLPALPALPGAPPAAVLLPVHGPPEAPQWAAASMPAQGAELPALPPEALPVYASAEQGISTRAILGVALGTISLPAILCFVGIFAGIPAICLGVIELRALRTSGAAVRQRLPAYFAIGSGTIGTLCTIAAILGAAGVL